MILVACVDYRRPVASDAVASSSAPAPTLAAAGPEIFHDDFNASSGSLSTGDLPGTGSAQYVDGALRMTADHQTNEINYVAAGTTTWCLGHPCATPANVRSNLGAVSVSVGATQTAGSTSGWYGIACAYQAGGIATDLVALTISSDGRHYAITQNSSSGATPYDTLLAGAIRGEVSPAIHGLGERNQIRADCGTTVMALSVNGQVLASAVPDRTELAASTGIALIASGIGPGDGPTVDFEDLVVSSLDADPTLVPPTGALLTDPLTEDLGIWLAGSYLSLSTDFSATGYRETTNDDDVNYFAIPATSLEPADTSAEVTVTARDVPGLGFGGVICGLSQRGYYALDVTPNGTARLAQVPGGEDSSFTTNPAINAGLGASNQLRLDCVGSTVTGWVNGAQVGQMARSAPNGSGRDTIEVYGSLTGTSFEFRDFTTSWPHP